jgi:hypothetical protein
METFVRQSFYLEPPNNASPEEWQEWLRQDNLKARGAKAAFTRSQKAQECDIPYLTGEGLVRENLGLVKFNGVWSQSPAMFSGSAEDGTVQREVAVESSQAREAILSRQEHPHRTGSRTRRGRAKSKRQRIRARKRSRYQTH